MKVLKVIHGYPMRYNAGSEVYSQTLCQGLADRHQVHVFTREEDEATPPFHLRTEHDPDDDRITLHVVNNPNSTGRYRSTEIDQRFAEVLDRVRPDIVHIGHLNHLSTSLPGEAALREIPVVYTLHDYWLMCPRGQFMQSSPENRQKPGALCSGQANQKCADRCYVPPVSNAPDGRDAEVARQTDWVADRMAHVRQMVEMVDLFIAPAQYLLARYRDEFAIPECKLTYLDYGFERNRMQGRSRAKGEPFTFGYIGTHTAAKGIDDLIRAFGQLDDDTAQLRIWGRPRGSYTQELKAMAAALPPDVARRIEWLPEYRNHQIVGDVFNRCDAIVVPSIWVENSPLVIHEAQQARVPVITANTGGMAEYVHHKINGLLFEHRSATALTEQMHRLASDPELAERLGARGYLYSPDNDIPAIDTHIREVEKLYEQVLKRRKTTHLARKDGPWRITFDTNPDTCNLRCIMCEEHSPHSPLQIQRRAEGRPRRLMSLEMIERVIADAAPHGLREIIPSTMGEPLLYKQFEGILDLCKRFNVQLNLTTNGTFPRLGAEAWARKIVPVTSDVKISWNGATQATHEHIMLGSRWDKVLDNVRTFVAVRDEHAETGGNRCRVTFQLTFLEKNVAELADMVRLAVSLGVDRLKGHHLWAHFEEIQGSVHAPQPGSGPALEPGSAGSARSSERATLAQRSAHSAGEHLPTR